MYVLIFGSRRATVFPPIMSLPNGNTRGDRNPHMPSHKAKHSYAGPPCSTPTALTAYRRQQPTGWAGAEISWEGKT